jgi:hypothetical protein
VRGWLRSRFISANGSFDPEVITILCTAYDRTTAVLNDRGHARVVREIIGKRIVALAAKASATPSTCATPRWRRPVFAEEVHQIEALEGNVGCAGPGFALSSLLLSNAAPAVVFLVWQVAQCRVVILVVGFQLMLVFLVGGLLLRAA